MSNEYTDSMSDLAICRGLEKAAQLNIDLDDEETISDLIEEEYNKIIEESDEC